MSTAQDLINLAQGEVGYSRWDDSDDGTKYGRWYEAEVDGPGGYDYGASGVAYCAMFVSWCLAQLGLSCVGFPSAYCPAIHNHQTLTVDQLRPGDIVLFDWEDDSVDDHVGIVKANDSARKVVTTIEGNTNNGRVANRERAWGTICGGMRPDFGGEANAPADKPTAPETGKEAKVYAFPLIKYGATGDAVMLMQSALRVRSGVDIAVDGKYGKNTGKALRDWQTFAGIKPDGDCGPITWGTLLLEA